MGVSPLLDQTESASFDAPELFLQSVPRTIVHRAAVSEVLATGLQRVGEDHYRVGVQWPRSHSYYGRVAGRWHDPMLLAESIRQALLVIAHQEYGVPLGHKFLSSSLDYHLEPDGARLTERPAHILLDIRCHNIKRRGRSISAMDLEVDCLRDGTRVGSGAISAQCVPEVAYRRLRGERADNQPGLPMPDAVRPRLVGRDSVFDVVLGASRIDRVWTLRYDRDHPVLFDHPVDHVPGMVLMEAARQSALAVLGTSDGLIVSCESAYQKYVEFDSTCLVTATPKPATGPGPRTVAVGFNQGGATAATCEVQILAA
ncbi:ScbA/BarX family gamma-butyrolactone biosynthesis protein [Streptomyces griseorubiginosus]|uniref:ScbA/BarX family gamma-butyrolactone biosynthesis protein n=1 Tax=Streptomyces griseorubiginosus TaxID=67304 RepID=UPI0033C8955C